MQADHFITIAEHSEYLKVKWLIIVNNLISFSFFFLHSLAQEKMLKTQAWEQGVFGVGFHQKIFSLGIFILL